MLQIHKYIYKFELSSYSKCYVHESCFSRKSSLHRTLLFRSTKNKIIKSISEHFTQPNFPFLQTSPQSRKEIHFFFFRFFFLFFLFDISNSSIRFLGVYLAGDHVSRSFFGDFYFTVLIAPFPSLPPPSFRKKIFLGFCF